MERRQLAAWILACADGQEPKDRTKISTKIKVMLKTRHASNKRKKYELACVCEVTPRARMPSGSGARACGPKSGLCKVRVCVAARKPLLLGYTPAVGLLEGPKEVGAP